MSWGLDPKDPVEQGAQLAAGIQPDRVDALISQNRIHLSIPTQVAEGGSLA